MSDRPTEPADDIDWDALARYLAGESPAAEAHELEQWIHADPRRDALVRGLSDALDASRTPAPADLDVEAALARTKRSLGIGSGHAQAAIPAARARPQDRWALRIAAAVAVIVGSVLVFRLAGDGFQPRGVATEDVHTTGTGELRRLVLEDGTRVALGAGSELSVAPGFGEVHHDVSLSGVAFFEVAPASAGVFTVSAGDVIVRDLGTSFTVHAGSRSGVDVLVTEGSVSVRNRLDDPAAAVVLRAGERAMLAPGGSIELSPAAVTGADLAWLDGELVFREARLERVAGDLLRWYGITLRIADPELAGRRLTAEFAGESAEEIGLILSLALGVEVTVDGRTVTLRQTAERGR